MRGQPAVLGQAKVSIACTLMRELVRGKKPTTGAKKGAPVASSLGCACAARAASSLFATFFAWSYSLQY